MQVPERFHMMTGRAPSSRSLRSISQTILRRLSKSVSADCTSNSFSISGLQ